MIDSHVTSFPKLDRQASHILDERARRKGRGGLVALAIAASLTGACGDAPPDDASDGAPRGETAAVEGVHGLAPAPVGGIPSVVVLHPSPPASPSADRETPRINQLGLAFTPSELMLMIGERVAFTNSETITHNVHVRFTDTDSTVLNVDTDPGGRAEFVFEREGGYDVLCDTHPGMRAFIYVSSSPYAVFADRQGSFQVTDVPPGSYTVSVWSVDPELRIDRVVEVTGPSTELSLGAR